MEHREYNGWTNYETRMKPVIIYLAGGHVLYWTGSGLTKETSNIRYFDPVLADFVARWFNAIFGGWNEAGVRVEAKAIPGEAL